MNKAQREFEERIWAFYHDHGRDLLWRHDPTPYGVFISEVMLQQTQVARVSVKYSIWLARFPDFASLAAASVAEVVEAWQGMGYNRRALWLQRAARSIISDYGGVLPRSASELVKLPGIGPNTAGSIAAFAYDLPTVFIETNIRRVFIHEFFKDRTEVEDREIMPLVEATIDPEHPREWYYALMDYGANLAKEVVNPNRRSRHYVRQSVFEGSLRQIRGEVLRQLLAGPKAQNELRVTDVRLAMVLEQLLKEGFINRSGTRFALIGK